MLRFTTAGESHGPALVSILEGMVAGLPLAAADIELSEEEVEAIAEAVPAAAGDRYDEMGMRSVNI